jgi:ankyrin repeat protein
VIDYLFKNTKTKELIDEKNKEGFTPLHIAVKSKCLGATMKLIQFGANINNKDSLGNTPLILAIKKKNLTIVKVLIYAGAKITLSNKKKESPNTLLKEFLKEATTEFDL